MSEVRITVPAHETRAPPSGASGLRGRVFAPDHRTAADRVRGLSPPRRPLRAASEDLSAERGPAPRCSSCGEGPPRSRGAELDQDAAGFPKELGVATRERAAQAMSIHQIVEERRRQDAQWGGPEHDDHHSRREWLGFIDEHVTRARKALGRASRVNMSLRDADEYRKQLVEIAALAIAAVAAHDRS